MADEPRTPLHKILFNVSYTEAQCQLVLILNSPAALNKYNPRDEIRNGTKFGLYKILKGTLTEVLLKIMPVLTKLRILSMNTVTLYLFLRWILRCNIFHLKVLFGSYQISSFVVLQKQGAKTLQISFNSFRVLLFRNIFAVFYRLYFLLYSNTQIQFTFFFIQSFDRNLLIFLPM